MIKETSLATVVAASLSGAGTYGVLDRLVFPSISENKEAISLAQNKSDTGNLVTTKLVEDHIMELTIVKPDPLLPAGDPDTAASCLRIRSPRWPR